MQFIINIKEIPVKEARNAEMALLYGNQQDAEAILLQAGLIFRAIMLNIQLYNWDRYAFYDWIKRLLLFIGSVNLTTVVVAW